jgi:hypothetical protein
MPLLIDTVSREDLRETARLLEVLKDQPITETITLLNRLADREEGIHSISFDAAGLLLCRDLLLAASKVLRPESSLGQNCATAAGVLTEMDALSTESDPGVKGLNVQRMTPEDLQ